MNAKSDISALLRQTRRYEFSDGLVELQVGVVMIALGIGKQCLK